MNGRLVIFLSLAFVTIFTFPALAYDGHSKYEFKVTRIDRHEDRRDFLEERRETKREYRQDRRADRRKFEAQMRRNWRALVKAKTPSEHRRVWRKIIKTRNAFYREWLMESRDFKRGKRHGQKEFCRERLGGWRDC